jgi:hypothetical protein
MLVSFVLPVEFIAEPGGGDEVMSSYSRSHESRTLNKKAQTDKTIVFPSNNSHTFYFEYYASIHFSDMVANLLNNSAQA